MSSEKKLKIIIDHREPQAIVEYLKNFGMEITIKQLTIADYIFSDDVACERKTGKDLAASLKDNRLFSQIEQLTENYAQPLLILENLSSAFERPEWQRRKKHIFGALTYIALWKRLPIIPTSNLEETAILLNRIASWTQEEKKEPVLTRSVSKKKSLHDQQLFFLEGLFDVGAQKAELLLNTFNHSPYKVINAIANTHVHFTKTGKPKKITGPLTKIKGIGPQFVLKNKTLLGLKQSSPLNLIDTQNKKTRKNKENETVIIKEEDSN